MKLTRVSVKAHLNEHWIPVLVVAVLILLPWWLAYVSWVLKDSLWLWAPMR